MRTTRRACFPIRPTGARFGIGFFIPFVVLTFVMGFIVQEMTVRLGAVTHRGHAELIFDRFGKFWGFFAMGDLVLGNFLTLVTEFIGVRAGLGFFGIRPVVAVGVGARRSWSARSRRAAIGHGNASRMGLAIFNGLFIPAAILARPDWLAVGHALLTWTPLPTGNRYEILAPDSRGHRRDRNSVDAFFQQSAVVDKGMQPRDINAGRFDTFLGALLAAIFAIAAILATAPLFHHGIDASQFQARAVCAGARAVDRACGRRAFRAGNFRGWDRGGDRNFHVVGLRVSAKFCRRGTA